MTCPSCGKPKTVRAVLCAACRKLAITIGVQLLLEPGNSLGSLLERIAERTQPVGPRTPGQNRAFHAKCGTIAVRDELEPAAVKAQALDYATGRFERLIDSSSQLNESEMSDVLDWLDYRLAPTPKTEFAI